MFVVFQIKLEVAKQEKYAVHYLMCHYRDEIRKRLQFSIFWPQNYRYCIFVELESETWIL